MRSVKAWFPARPFAYPIPAKPASVITSAETVRSISTRLWPRTGSLGELARLKFAWEVYNITNSVRFDDGSYNNNGFGNALTYPGLGFYVQPLGSHQFRRMQFGLRLDF